MSNQNILDLNMPLALAEPLLNIWQLWPSIKAALNNIGLSFDKPRISVGGMENEKTPIERIYFKVAGL